MKVEKGKTYQYLRDKRKVSESARENLKYFIKVKKAVLDALKEGDLTIDQLKQKVDLPREEVVFYLMTLIKYGFVKTGDVDDMDEYYSYKLKE